MCHSTRFSKSLRGLTLIELLVSITLSMLITTAVATLYMQSTRNYTEDERYARLQANGRYALSVLTEDLMMADFWGEFIGPAIMTCDDTLATSSAAGVTCKDIVSGNEDCNIALYDYRVPLLYNDGHNGTQQFDITTCTGTIMGSVKNKTSQVAIKRVASAPTRAYLLQGDVECNFGLTPTGKNYYDKSNPAGCAMPEDPVDSDPKNAPAPADGEVFLRSNGVNACMIVYSTADNNSMGTNCNPPKLPLGFSDWKYQPSLYFIREGTVSGSLVPQLCRSNLSGKGFAKVGAEDCLVEGVEDLHIEFGLDVADSANMGMSDGIVDIYSAPAAPKDMCAAMVARIYILMRSNEQLSNYVNKKTYQMGDPNISGYTLGPFNDGYYRKVYSTTVRIRNTANMMIFERGCSVL